ncbi:MAG: hypothetical protein WAM95_19885 [Bacillus sp. (in: firmicutes)]
MNILSKLLTGMNSDISSIHSKMTFQPGQILNGKIIKLFPNGIASLQVGPQKMVAQLEASLDVKHRYWFQVQPGDGKVKLKVIGIIPESRLSQDGTPITGLMNELSILTKDVKEETIRFFLKEQLPINKEIIQSSAGLLKESNSLQDGHEAIKLILQRQLPMTKETFHAILTALDDQASITHLMNRLSDILQKGPLSVNTSKLLHVLQTLMSSDMNIDRTRASETKHDKGQLLNVSDLFKQVISTIGYAYENSAIQYMEQRNKEFDKDMVLKPLLIDFLKENPEESAKITAEKLLHKITGLQLLGQESSPVLQQVVQIPINIQSKMVDLTLQWNGRRKANSTEIDPAFCRVLFYLELETLQETFVDMQVQNRIITVTVMNENQHLSMLAKPLISNLKEGLDSLNYTLSNVHFTNLSRVQEEKSPTLLNNSHYSGVDLRI